MTRSLRFFYFGNQCPHNGYLLARIKTIAWKESVPLRLDDVTDDESTCAEFGIFSPQMLLVNGRYRLHGPFDRELVLALLDDEQIQPRRYAVRQSGDVVRGDLLPLTPGSALRTCDTCSGTGDPGICRGKEEWVRDMMRRTGLPHLGHLHMLDGRCVGGVEFLPSAVVPYPMPSKGPREAFLTCVFLSDEEHDYKTHPLERLLSELPGMGFDTVSVAASKNVVFPNGPSSWFEERGFRDEGLLAEEEMQGAQIRHLQMRL